MAPSLSPATQAQPAALPPWLLFCLSFFGGFYIMALEVCGFRVLQTQLGSSVIVTGTLLTMIMVFLSAGYYCGGVLSKKFTTIHLLLLGLILAALYSHIVNVVLYNAVTHLGLRLRDLYPQAPFLRSGVPATFLVLLLYGPPIFATSMISPVLIRLQTVRAPQARADAGLQSGFFMALSTAGSIIGTLLSSYMFIPFFGTTTTIVVTNTCFLVLVLLCWIKLGSFSFRSRFFCGFFTFLYLASCLVGLSGEQDTQVIYEKESYYGHIQILKKVDEAHRTLLEYRPSRVYTHSVLYPDEPLRDLEGLLYLVPALLRPPEKILVLGSAAGGILRQLDLVFPQAYITGVDIDPAIHQVAREIFHVDTTKTSLVARDARMFLADTAEQYDFIILDLFAGEFIPLHCITLEFFQLVKSRLTPHGFIFINTNMQDIHFELPQNQEPFRPVRHLHSTLRVAGFQALFETRFFPGLYVYADDMPLPELLDGLWDLVDHPALHAATRAVAGLAAYTTVAVPDRREQYRFFTDNWTPGVLIELKANEQQIYAALKREVTRHHAVPLRLSLPPVHALPRLVLEQIFTESTTSGYLVSSMRDPARLIERLNRLLYPVVPSDLDTAARYLRYSFYVPNNPHVFTASPWAKIALLYAQLYRFAYDNNYESLGLTLNDLQHSLSRSNRN